MQTASPLYAAPLNRLSHSHLYSVSKRRFFNTAQATQKCLPHEFKVHTRCLRHELGTHFCQKAWTWVRVTASVVWALTQQETPFQALYTVRSFGTIFKAIFQKRKHIYTFYFIFKNNFIFYLFLKIFLLLIVLQIVLQYNLYHYIIVSYLSPSSQPLLSLPPPPGLHPLLSVSMGCA